MTLGQADINTFAQAIPYIGVPGAMLLVALFAIWKKWFVPGWILADVMAQRDELQDKCNKLDQQGRDDAQRYLSVILRQQGITQTAVNSALRVGNAGGENRVEQS